jgi:hypothetical protein
VSDREPINMATGEYHALTDWLNLGRPLPLELRLYYGSQLDAKPLPDGLPRRFAHNHRGALVRAA